jgi:hypothetical protein
MPLSWTLLDDDQDTGTSITASFQRLESQTHALKVTRAGAVEPDDPEVGDQWLDTSTTPHVLKVYAQIDAGGAAWRPVGPYTRLADSINADPGAPQDRAEPFVFKGFRFESLADFPGIVATNTGFTFRLTGTGEIWSSDSVVAGGWRGLMNVVKNVSLDTQELPLESDFGNDGVDPPTRVAKGVLEGWLFDDVDEARTVAFVVPKNWDGATDMKVRLHQVLDEAETANDSLEWSGEVRVLPLQGGKTTKAATALAASVLDIGAVADAIDEGGGPHVSELTIDYDDVDNPLSVGALVLVTVWRTTVGGAGKVAGSVVFRADLAYAQKPRHERA